MIARYSLPEMAAIWSDRSRYQVWLEVELAVCEYWAQQGKIPKAQWSLLKKKCQALLKKGGVDPKRVDAIEKVTRHDVIAFTTAVAEKVGPTSRYVHYGLTSSDVVDTALSISIQRAGKIILSDIEVLLKELKRLAIQFKHTPCIGRSHGIHAEPTSFGLKFLGWHQEWKRNRSRISSALEALRVGKLSGAVGVNAHFSPASEKRILKALGLEREKVSTQVLPRDRHAELMAMLAVAGGSMERICIELRHLQRSEVGEVLEGFGKGQKGSSAMPHKRNPISTENLTGAARMLRSFAAASFENVALWHERDISHSSVERVTFVDGLILMDYALQRLTRVLSSLEVRTGNVAKNLSDAGEVVFSGHYLLALVERGITREKAYAWVQSCALQSLNEGSSFVELMEQHAEVSKVLKRSEIKRLGSIEYQIRHVDEIYREAERE